MCLYFIYIYIINWRFAVSGSQPLGGPQASLLSRIPLGFRNRGGAAAGCEDVDYSEHIRNKNACGSHGDCEARDDNIHIHCNNPTKISFDYKSINQ